MYKTQQIVDDAKDSCRSAEAKLKLSEAKPAVAELDNTTDSNEKRATEVGPVLEEILHARWNHWNQWN